MGSYSQLTIADYPIFENKNWYFEEIINHLFQQDDYKSIARNNSSRNKIVWGDAFDNDHDIYEFKGYHQTVKVCRQRLEIYGMSYEKAKADFAKAKLISKQEEIYGFSLQKITYAQYLLEVQQIIESQKKGYDEFYTNLKDSLIIGNLGIYGQSLAYHLYSILSVLPDDAVIEYDFSEVIEGGWVKEEQALKIDYEKIIILTEGKTDVEFISKSIQKLYPHLVEYYHFIDFSEHNVESNASALVKLILSFAAANVKHPVIALFDNDTTGLMEMKKLVAKALPDNIKVLRYPDISLAKKYPTIGPTGNKRVNVNGMACGIEMYLGIDVLTLKGEFIPIQWKGYNERENKYQGEIAQKLYVQEEFRKKIKSDRLGDFDEMDLLLNKIFCAYR